MKLMEMNCNEVIDACGKGYIVDCENFDKMYNEVVRRDVTAKHDDDWMPDCKWWAYVMYTIGISKGKAFERQNKHIKESKKMGKVLEYADSIDTDIDNTSKSDTAVFNMIQSLLNIAPDNFEPCRNSCLAWCEGNERLEILINLFFDTIGKERGLVPQNN